MGILPRVFGMHRYKTMAIRRYDFGPRVDVVVWLGYCFEAPNEIFMYDGDRRHILVETTSASWHLVGYRDSCVRMGIKRYRSALNGAVSRI